MSGSPYAKQLAQVDFFTTTHRISGQVQTGTKPLSDLLNDRTLSYVVASSIYISRLNEPGAIGAHMAMGYLLKDNLSFIIAAAREARVGERSRFTAQEYAALITVPGFEIRGTFLGPRRIDMQSFAPTSLEPFVILLEATAVMASLPDITFTGEAILVNRGRLESLGLSE